MSRAALIGALLAGVAAVAWSQARDARRSGFDYMSAGTQAMQRDDTANPGMLYVLQGGDLWRERTGAAGRSCADCHGDDAAAMRGVAARYPAFDSRRQTPVDLAGRIRNAAASASWRRPRPARAARCWRSPPSSPTSRAACRSRQARIRAWRRRSPRGARSTTRGWASSPCPARSATTTMPGGSSPARRSRGASHRLSDLPARMAGPRFAAASPAHLPHRRARRALRLRRARVHAAGTVPDGSRARHADGDARRAALSDRDRELHRDIFADGDP
jgi:hypothetical protein